MPSKAVTGNSASTKHSAGLQSNVTKGGTGGKDSRIHTAKSPTAVLLSGSLKEELKSHAFERCRHFFLYLCTAKALEYVNNKDATRAKISALQALVKKATDQIDDGFKESKVEYVDFPRDDETVIDKPTTSFTNIDAAHFCNLGVKHDFASKLDLSNQVVRGLYEELKRYSGNTRWLPKLVNIGPDRKIDVLHGELGEEILKDATAATCSRKRISDYVSKAEARLNEYIAKKSKAKKRGVGKCAWCYIAGYQEKDFVDRVFKEVDGAMIGWCCATDNRDAAPLLVAN